MANARRSALTVREQRKQTSRGPRKRLSKRTLAKKPLEAGEEVEAGEETEAPVAASAMRYRKQRRGGKGLRDIRTSERNGPVIGIASVRDGDDIMLITTQGMVNRTHVREIRIVGRNTQGVRIMNLNEEDKIASIAKIAKEDVQEEIGTGETSPETPPVAPNLGE